MDKLEKVEKKLDKVQEKFDNTSLALEMLRELKRSSKRWFIISIVLLIALFATNIAWLIRENSFETIETTEQYMEDIQGDNSQFTQTIN